MKRGLTSWQGVVLLLVLTMTVGVYLLLGWLLYRMRGEGQSKGLAAVSSLGPIVQIIEPLDGAVLQQSAVATVRSAVTEPGFVQAELRVDGRAIAVEVNPEPGAAPWIVEWAWEHIGEGPHALALQARTSGGEIHDSPAVLVTVVPGGSLVFSSNRDGAYAIYNMLSDGTGLVRLGGGPGDARQPAVGREGWLTFVSKGEGGQAIIGHLSSTGEEGAGTVVGADPAWSRDGSWLAYSSSVGGASQVFVAPGGGGEATQVTYEGVYAGQPAWSPDGQFLAYVAERDNNLDIWVVGVDGMAARRLTDEPAMDWAPAWSPDGSQLAFVSDRGGNHQIYAMQADGTQVRRLSDYPLGAERPAWSPDGYWLAVIAYTGEGIGVNTREIHLMRADGQSQVRLTHNTFDDTDVDWSGTP